ncbi:MAG: serine/threonine protein kinase, partial [Actinomycetota bacterium]|nr:serine/threonine protein kinase [Actinomycetota bacterium]
MDLGSGNTSPWLLGGRYRVGRLLGQGGMADVYAAVDELDGNTVAVKVLRDPLLGGTDADADVLAGLRHPGLVELLDVGEDQGRRFCVMTLVEGPTLAARLSQGALGLESTAHLGADVTSALAYVHAHGVVHRDVKPANVLLDADGRPRLADFGIARLVDATRVTRTGFAVGTASYLAPEQVSGARIGP